MKKLDTSVHVVVTGTCTWKQALRGIDRIFAPAVGCSAIRYADDLDAMYTTLESIANDIVGNFPQMEFTEGGYPTKVSYQSFSGRSGLVWADGKYAIWALPGSNTLRHNLFLSDEGCCHVFAAEILPDEDRAGLLAI